MPCNTRDIKIPRKVSMDYCPHCRRRTEHVKDAKYKMCKTCGKTEKRIILV